MGTVPSTTRTALYARVSSEDQAERQTIDAQLTWLRRFAELQELPVAGVYVDDGVSGTIPLDERPDGKRLIDDARAGQFSSVLVMRVNRLGRTLRTLLGAHELLESAGVAIKSGTEPFDTASPVGKFVFQLLASLAELDRATMLEQMTHGRDRVARDGRYTGGPIPFGYMLDAARRFVPSERTVEPLGMTEAELVRDIFGRIASGTASLTSESERLSALGIDRTVRYAPSRRDGGPARMIAAGARWGQTSLGQMIHNPMYRGSGTIASRHGTVSRPAPALVEASVWDAAQRATAQNILLSRRPGDSDYLLRGLVTCGVCGRRYCGARGRRGEVKYRCNSLRDRATSETPCYAGQVDGARLEQIVWDEVTRFVAEPDDYLAAARGSARAALADGAGSERQRKALTGDLAGKEAERQRVLELYRRGKIDSAECDRELDKVAAEARLLREQIDGLRAQSEMASAEEAYLSDVGSLLAIAREEVAEIERTGDRVGMRKLIEGFVPEITIETTLLGATAGGRKRTRASVRLRLAFGAPATRRLADDGVMSSTTVRRDASYHTTLPPIMVLRDLARV